MDWNVQRVARISIVAAVLACVALSWYQPLQDAANGQVDEGLKRALMSFASARTLNAVISVIQGTEFSFQPIGVGVTLTLGQILDPVNDLIEQFAGLMLVASVAFGIQKALLAVGAHWAISAIVSGVAAVWGVLQYIQKAPAWLSRALIVLVMIRFAIPVVTVGSDWVFHQFLAKEYQEQQAALDMTSQEISKQAPKIPTGAPGPAQDKGWLEQLKERAVKLLPGSNTDFEAIKKSAAVLPERVIKLIVIFLLQTMIIPIILLWGLYRIALGVVHQPERATT